jgi:hypothetical protein
MEMAEPGSSNLCGQFFKNSQTKPGLFAIICANGTNLVVENKLPCPKKVIKVS